MNDPEHERPASASDETVEVAGKVTEALEWIELRTPGRPGHEFRPESVRVD